MYRNSYLQLYKTTANNNPNLTILMTHFTQIYNTLGCVLQDLQFQIGKFQAQQITPSIGLKQQYQQYKKTTKDKKQLHHDKELVVIDASQNQNREKNHLEKKYQEQKKDNKIKGDQVVKKQENVSEQLEFSWMDRIVNQQHKKQNSSGATDRGRISAPVVVEKVRGYSKPHGNDSFDSLFENKGNRRQSMEIEKPRYQSPLPSIPQLSQQNSQPRVGGTYEDFLDRIFRQGESRKSK